MDEGHTSVQHVERVARFSVGDFDRLLGANGLTIDEVYGDYRLGTYAADSSPRLILVARKTGERLLARQLFADPADGLGRHAEV